MSSFLPFASAAFALPLILAAASASAQGQEADPVRGKELAERYGFPSEQAVYNAIYAARKNAEVQAVHARVVASLQRVA